MNKNKKLRDFSDFPSHIKRVSKNEPDSIPSFLVQLGFTYVGRSYAGQRMYIAYGIYRDCPKCYISCQLEDDNMVRKLDFISAEMLGLLNDGVKLLFDSDNESNQDFIF